MLFLVTDMKSVDVQPWLHAGWYGGTILFFLGALTGRLSFINGASTKGQSEETDEVPARSNTLSKARLSRAASSTEGSFLGHVAGGALAGGILGGIFGASLLVFWFSFACSPLSTANIASSVEFVPHSPVGGKLARTQVQTQHPIALELCLTPAVVGSVCAAIAGGILYYKYRPEDPTENSAA
ncbi:hypothetical protein [Aureliella helgolandensis]|nr:hypothetical protein [Aureliella helgolandensis]